MATEEEENATVPKQLLGSVSSNLSSVTFRSRSLHSLVVVPLLTNTSESHSSRSLQGFVTALQQHPYSCNKKNDEEDITWVVPNSALTRPGDWKYEATPFKAFHWQYGAQRMRIVERRSGEGALDGANKKPKDNEFRDLHPHLRTAAVLGVLNIHDCLKSDDRTTSVEEAVQRACTELQQWAKLHATSSYGDNGSSPDIPVTRLLVFDSFDVEGGMDLLTMSGGMVDRSSVIAFPPTTHWDDPTLTLHLSWVLSDVLVAIFRDLERKVQPFTSRAEATDATTSSTGLTRRSLARLISSTASTVSDEETPPSLPTAVVPPRPHDATEGPVAALPTATPPATSSLASFSYLSSLKTPLDDEFPPLTLESATPKDLEALRKRGHGRREKWIGDLALLVGSPMDAYERYLKAIELCKPVGASSGMDPLWYAAALEGCAAAHLAMAEVGGYGVDEYLENHFQLPEEIMALARDDASAKKTGHKQTLPEVVFALCEEALQILSRHEKLENLYAELLLQLAHYCADEAEGHLRCRWGEGPFGYAGDSGEVPRWEKTSVSQMKFRPLKTKEGGHSMIAINTYNRIKKLCELLNAAVSIGTLEAPTRLDVALRSAQICLVGVKPTHWKGPVPDRVQLPRKAAYFTAVAADAWSGMSSAQRSSVTAQDLWLLATRLYTRNPNSMDGSGGNYGWASLRAFCLDGLAHQGTTDLSLEASDQLLSLLGKLEPDSTSPAEEQKEEEPPIVAMDESNRESDTVSKDMPRAAVNVDDSDVQEALSTANQFAKNLRNSYNTLAIGSSILAQQAKWAGENPIPSIDVPLSQPSVLSSVLIALKAVWPNMSFTIASVAQKQCLERATVLRRAIPTSSFRIDTAAHYGLFEKELPLYVSSDLAVVPEPALDLECIKKRVPTGSETGGVGMETFFNPFAKKSVEDGPIVRVAEDEERVLIVTFGNRLSLPLQIQRSEVIFDQPSCVQTTAVSFAIPPKVLSFAVRFPFRVVSDGSDANAITSEDVRVFNVKGVHLTCLGRELFLPIQPMKKPVVQASSESTTLHVPKTPQETKGKKSVIPRVESYPIQPKLEIMYADTNEAVPDIVSISLTDGEIFNIPTWRLKNLSGRSKIAQMETLELVLMSTSNRKLFDSSVDTQKELSDDQFVEDMMFGTNPPPFKVRALSSGLNMDDVNRETGATVTIQIAAPYNLRKKLPNGYSFDIHCRYHGVSTSKTEVWRKRVLSFRLAHAPGPRIASVSFRPDLATDRAFYDVVRKQWSHNAEIGAVEHSEVHATAADSQMIFTAIGQHPSVDVCGSKAFLTLTVANETRAMLCVTRQHADATMRHFPWNEMSVNAGVSAKIPIEIPRIERVDETGIPQDVWGEFARLTALRWETRDDDAIGRKRRGYIRIPPEQWNDIVGRFPAVVSHICTPPCSIAMQINDKSVSEAAISVPLGHPISVSMEMTFAPWVPAELASRLLVTMEFQCNRRTTGSEEGSHVSSSTHCDFVGAGQWQRTVRDDDMERKDAWIHEMKIAFCAIGQYCVTASVRISRSDDAAPEIWWSPLSQAIQVQETNLVAQ